MLLIDIRDSPGNSRWLLYNLSSGSLQDVGHSKTYAFFLDRARVALNDGRAFGRGGAGFVRLNFACPRTILVEALERMRHALERRP